MNELIRRLRLVLTAATVLALLLALPAVASAKRHHASRDRNHDGIPDKWAKRFHLGKGSGVASADPDKDGLSNLGEFLSGTNPRVADTNHNGVSDANDDADHDGVDNRNEIREHTNPRSADTNHNGVKDGKEDADKDGLDNAGEQAAGTDPTNADTDGDGIKDGNERAGDIVSFDGTTLTVRLFTGATLTGTVDDNTFIDCGQDTSTDPGAGDGSPDSSSTDPAADGWVDEPVDGKVHARDGAGLPTAGDGTDPGADDPSADDGSTDPSTDGTDTGATDDGSGDGTDTSGDGSGGCVPADTLKPGVAVNEADVSFTSDGTFFDAIELAH